MVFISYNFRIMIIVILDACNEINDGMAEQVRIPVEGAITDLHAADTLYHNDCRIYFLYF